MSSATSQSKAIQARIVESFDAQARVEPEAGIIRNVKLIGFQSKNGRTYPAQVLKNAVALYEGAKVNIDHPEGSDPTLPRKYGERFGVIRNARFTENRGIFGDCHFNPKHPAAEQVCWDASNNPEALGFSHNALLRMGKSRNGGQVVESIVSIRSMDLVADPATTVSLFESENPMDEMTVSTPSDPKTAMKGAFRQMIVAAVDDESLDMKATMKKIKEIMTAQSKLMGGEVTPEEEPTEESTKLKMQVGLLQQQLEQFQERERHTQRVASIDKMLVQEGLDPKNPLHVSELFSKQLLAVENEDQRLALIRDRKGLLGTKPHTGGMPTYTPQTTQATEQIDARAFASRLLS